MMMASTADSNSRNNNIGIVNTKFFSFASSAAPFSLETGESLDSVTIAYETYGTLNASCSNAILITHALSGDAHVAGMHPEAANPGWWDNMVGPGKAFDTDKYFVICSNIIGGCRGSTGPASVNPGTGKPYGLSFPVITIGDMVNAQKKLIDHLSIRKLLAVAGGSMGGMQALQWLVSYPDKVISAIPISTTMCHSPQQIAFNEVGRQAIMADADWRGGDYYGKVSPSKGLAVARMVGHITYMSERSMEDKFGRQAKLEKRPLKFDPGFEVEGYLQHQGKSFVGRFDANSYLYITKAMDLFDLKHGDSLSRALRGRDLKVMVIAFKSDWLYPLTQTQDIVRACKQANIDATYCEINSVYGHDAFLLETEEETHLIKYFLERVFSGRMVVDYVI